MENADFCSFRFVVVPLVGELSLAATALGILPKVSGC